jgi:3-methyladenine DNA glycosylase/8-oxoguanine DNA glycosylase
VPLLRLPAPYDFALSTERFRAFGPDLANLWYDGALHRVVDGHEVRIEPADGGVHVEPLDDTAEPVVRMLLGADFDLDGFARFAAGDAVLRRIVPALAGLRPPLAPDPFESLVTSITAQQVSLRAAFAIRNRLIQLLGTPALRAYAFPSKERVASASPVSLREIGLSTRKAENIVALARSDLDLDALSALSDEEVKSRLTALPGIGEWTADWFLARHLARPRAWPAGDLGLVKAVRAFYGGDGDVRAFGERFAPFQNLTAHYLLTALRMGFA